MRILFISNDLLGGNIARLLQCEGHEVKLYIEDKESRCCFENMITKIHNWQKEIEWVGKDGLIIFDDVGYGKIQDNLRKQGYTVFGGSEIGERLEQDRDFGQKIFKEQGLLTSTLIDFDNIKSAISFVKQNPRSWVIKHNNNHCSKMSNYVGVLDDGRDVIDVLENLASHPRTSTQKICLQQKVIGIEMGIGRYFNGKEWVGPIEINIEYPRFFPGDIGPITNEMGTLAWYSNDENNRLYNEVLLKMKPFLMKTGFRGDFEINCIVNESGAYPLEATTRLGSPIVHLQTEIHNSPWSEFLYAVARGEQYDLQWKRGFGIVVMGVLPPFPYIDKREQSAISCTRIFLDKCSEEELRHIHFEEVSKRGNQYIVSNCQGYILYVTAISKEVPTAQKKVYDILKKICIPQLFYRNDIGNSFLENSSRLQQWGYL